MGMDFKTNERIIREATLNALKRAEEKGIKSIAFPALGCGVGKFPLELSAKVISQAIFSHLRSTDSCLEEIVLVLYRQEDERIFNKVVHNYLSYIERKIGNGPFVTVDAIVEKEGGVVLIKRKNPPFGWALPGGFVDYGERLEEAVKREVKEETGLEITEVKQFHTYSAPERDPRFHTVSTVFIAKGQGKMKAESDAQEVKVFSLSELPEEIAFDHRQILEDYKKNADATKA